VVVSRDDGDEGIRYKVQIAERTMWFRREDLEPWPEPNAKLQRWSKEWSSELARFNELGRQWLAKPSDQNILRQYAESGEKLGFLVPIE
jgi:hypothetical protein